MKMFLAGLMLGAFAMMLAMSYHVVNTHQGYTLIARANQPPLRSVYLDARTWTVEKSRSYPEFVEAAVKAGRAELLLQGAISGGLDDIPQVEPVIPPTAIAENTRQAIKALVPIHFTDGQGNIAQQFPAIPPIGTPVSDNISVPNPGTGSSLFPGFPIVGTPQTPPSTSAPATPPTTASPPPGAMDPLRQVLSALGGNDIPVAIPQTAAPTAAPTAGSPIKVENMIPSYSQLQKQATEALPGKSEQGEWIQGLMKSLVNEGGTDTAVPRIQPRESLAHPKIGIEAPNPGSPPVFPNIFQNGGTAPSALQPDILPNVKAF